MWTLSFKLKSYRFGLNTDPNGIAGENEDGAQRGQQDGLGAEPDGEAS